MKPSMMSTTCRLVSLNTLRRAAARSSHRFLDVARWSALTETNDADHMLAAERPAPPTIDHRTLAVAARTACLGVGLREVAIRPTGVVVSDI